MIQEENQRLNRKLADVQDLNVKLKRQIENANKNTIENTIQLKQTARKLVVDEQKKTDIARKNAKQKVLEANQQMRMWQFISICMFGIGLIVGCFWNPFIICFNL